MKKFKTLLCILLAFCTTTLSLSATSFSAVATSETDSENSNDISSLVQKLQELDDKNKEYQKTLDKTKSDISKKEKYVETLVDKIGVLDEKIAVTNASIDRLNDSIDKKQTEVNRVNKNIDEHIDTLCNRLKTIYMAGSASDLEIILGAKNFSDFVDKIQLVKVLSEYDKNLIDSINAELDKVTEQKNELEKSKAEVEEQKESLQNDEDELNKLVDENKNALDELYKKSEETENNMHNAALDSKEIEQKIQDYYKELAKKSSTASSNDVSATGYTWPCPGNYYLTSQWNEDRNTYNHGAIDIGCSTGDTVVAAHKGTVVSTFNGCSHNWGKSGSCGCGGGYGNYVMIDHGNGKMTIYAHLTYAAVNAGEVVETGQTIGFAGSTGESTGTHLHFECRIYGVKYNPMIEFENE